MLESRPLTEVSSRSRRESGPQPPHEITSLGSGHNKDRLRYQPTEHHPINSTDPTNRRPSTAVRELSGTSQSLRGVKVRPQKRRMKMDERGRVSRGKRGSNETKLVLVGVASGRVRNLWNPSLPHAEVGSFASWIFLEPNAIRGRRVKSGEKGRE